MLFPEGICARRVRRSGSELPQNARPDDCAAGDHHQPLLAAATTPLAMVEVAQGCRSGAFRPASAEIPSVSSGWAEIDPTPIVKRVRGWPKISSAVVHGWLYCMLGCTEAGAV